MSKYGPNLYVGDLDVKVDEILLSELFSHFAVVNDVVIPKDAATGKSMGYAFVAVDNLVDAEYIIALLNGCPLYGRPIKVSKSLSETDKNAINKLQITGLSPSTTEYDLSVVLSRFGSFTMQPSVIRDAQNNSTGQAYVAMSTKEQAEAIITALNNNWLDGAKVRIKHHGKSK